MNKTVKFFASIFITYASLISCEEQNTKVKHPRTGEGNSTAKDSSIILGDSISKINKLEILSFLIQEEIEIISGPVLQVDYSVLQISRKTLKGFVGWASQGEAEYYISGSLNNDQYIGDVYQIGSNKVMGKFQLKIKDLKLKLKGDARVDHNEIPIYNGKHFFHGGAITNLLSAPNLKSAVLMPKASFMNNNRKGARIIEIGNYEKINGAYNLWYKVEIDNVTGWVFGGLCTTCLNAN
jgi:hypothetical protein